MDSSPEVEAPGVQQDHEVPALPLWPQSFQALAAWTTVWSFPVMWFAAAGVLAAQAWHWLKTAHWEPWPVSRSMSLLHVPYPVTELAGLQKIINWVLGVPTTVVLGLLPVLLAAVLFKAFNEAGGDANEQIADSHRFVKGTAQLMIWVIPAAMGLFVLAVAVHIDEPWFQVVGVE